VSLRQEKRPALWDNSQRLHTQIKKEVMMSRPLNKTQLLGAIQKEYGALEKFIATLNPEQMTFSAVLGAWAVKDILAHLYEWQQMFFLWYETGLQGEMPAIPAQGFKWNQLPALNQHIFEKHRALAADQVLTLFRESHQKTVQFIETQPDASLATPGLYKWMNQNTLMSYLNSITAAHYIWALKEAKNAVKA
jgi:hypothetical protein